MSFKTLLIQVAFLYAPLVRPPMEQVGVNLYRGVDPKISEIYALHEKGFKTIVSMRTNPENKKRKLCEKLGMRWINISTGVFLLPTDDQFEKFCSIVNDPKNLPCLVSCEIGMDRVGVYLGAHHMVNEGWTEQQMHEEFRQHHQKRWWPPFRKYEGAVVAYAEKHRKQQEQIATHASLAQESANNSEQ